MTAEVTLSILGSGFRVSSDDERMVELARELWAPFVMTNDDGGLLEAIVESRDEGWHLVVPDEPRVGARDPWVLASSLRNSLSRRAIRAAISIVPLHAAAVERDGVVVVLAGPPRAGKTTLLLDLLESGWLLVTDDLVPLDPGTLTATPFPKPLSVRDPERWARLSGGWDVPDWLPPPTAVGLLPATAVPRSTLEEYSPGVLVFPRFEPGTEPAIDPLSPAAVVAWAADNLHTRSPGASGVLPVLATLGQRTPGYTIRYGSTLAALELLEKSLAGA